jgi:hypothetical protein
MGGAKRYPSRSAQIRENMMGIASLNPSSRRCYHHTKLLWSELRSAGLWQVSTAVARRSRLAIRDETFEQVGQSLQLLPVLVDRLSNRFSVSTRQRPRNPAADPQERSYHQDERQPGYDKTDKPRNLFVHFDLPFVVLLSTASKSSSVRIPIFSVGLYQ